MPFAIFLVINNPEHAMTDFNVDAFLQFVNEELANKLQPLLADAMMTIQNEHIDDADEDLVTKLENLLMSQHTYLTPPGFELRAGSFALNSWIDYGETLLLSSTVAYWWLKGFALLAFPIIPVCTTAIWHFLGHDGEPVEKDYFIKTQVSTGKILPPFFKTISFEDISPALPATLFVNKSKN